MPSNGVAYVVYGEKTQREAETSLKRLRANMPDVKTIVIHDRVDGLTDAQASRFAKVNLDKLTPFDHTLYLDADTRPQADLSSGFEMLADGWELVIAPSNNQGQDCLWHVGKEEREITLKELGRMPLQLQAGIFFFQKTPNIRRLFELWREEWKRYYDQDQAAFLRALARQPVKIWLLGRPWNGGALVQHLYGRCRN